MSESPRPKVAVVGEPIVTEPPKIQESSTVICKDCKFFTPSGVSPGTKEEEGECRVNSRIPIFVEGRLNWLYPMQFATDFCKEWREK
jgi:hypothetical protein